MDLPHFLCHKTQQLVILLLLLSLCLLCECFRKEKKNIFYQSLEAAIFFWRSLLCALVISYFNVIMELFFSISPQTAHLTSLRTDSTFQLLKQWAKYLYKEHKSVI